MGISRKNQGRTFSVAFKKRQVDLYDRNLATVREISKEFDVSETAIYKWLKKYSKRYSHQVQTVVQMESEAHKNKALRARIAELERALGQKQMKIDYLEKLIEVSQNEFGIEIEKKVELPPLSGSGSTGKNIPGK